MSFSFIPHLHLVHLSLFTPPPFHELGKLPFILKAIADFTSSEALSPFSCSQEEVVIPPRPAHWSTSTDAGWLVEVYQRQRSCLLSSCSEFYTQSLSVSDRGPSDESMWLWSPPSLPFLLLFFRPWPGNNVLGTQVPR